MTGDESCICTYESKNKQHSTICVIEDVPNQASCIKLFAKRILPRNGHLLFRNNRHVTGPLEQRRTINSECYTRICLPERKNQRDHWQKTNHSHHDNTVLNWHPMIRFYSRRSTRSTFHDAWRSGWCVQITYFGVEKVLRKWAQIHANIILYLFFFVCRKK